MAATANTPNAVDACPFRYGPMIDGFRHITKITTINTGAIVPFKAAEYSSARTGLIDCTKFIPHPTAMHPAITR